MANKILQKKMKQVPFSIAKDAFKGPYKCCNKLTKKISKRIMAQGFNFDYEVWSCGKCNKEYLDSKQAKKLEKFWTIEKLLNDKLLCVKRNMNYDGNTYFFRFPKELTHDFNKNSHVDIKVITTELFLIEVKNTV